MIDEIIHFLKTNRVSTSEVADCMDKSGAILGVSPVNRGQYVVGPIRWIYVHDETNWNAHKFADSTEEGEVVLFDVDECNGRAVLGELICKFLLLYKQASGIVCTGNIRDTAAIIRNQYKVWAVGSNPIGCFNSKPQSDVSSERFKSGQILYDKAIAVCDDAGVVVIPRNLHTTEFKQKLIDIENQEDDWFAQLDREKKTTFEIVCLNSVTKK